MCKKNAAEGRGKESQIVWPYKMNGKCKNG